MSNRSYSLSTSGRTDRTASSSMSLSMPLVGFPQRQSPQGTPATGLGDALRVFSDAGAWGNESITGTFTGVADTVASLEAITNDIAIRAAAAADRDQLPFEAAPAAEEPEFAQSTRRRAAFVAVADQHSMRHMDDEPPCLRERRRTAVFEHAGNPLDADASLGDDDADSRRPSHAGSSSCGTLPYVASSDAPFGAEDCPLLTLLSSPSDDSCPAAAMAAAAAGDKSPLVAVSSPCAVVLGRGASGRVVLAFSPHVNARVAIKQVAANAAMDRRAEAASEVAFADRAAEHIGAAGPAGDADARAARVWAHVARVYGASVDQAAASCTIVTEALAGGTVADAAAAIAASAHAAAIVRGVVADVLRGLLVLHADLRVLHNDLKLDNVMFAAPLDLGAAAGAAPPAFTAKLIDFGCASLVAGGRDAYELPQRGALKAMAPERLHGRAYGAKADAWSVGVLALELARGGRHPFLDLPATCRAPRAAAAAAAAGSTDTFWRLAAALQFVDGGAECAAAVERAVAGCLAECAGPLAGDAAFADFVRSALRTDPGERAGVAELLGHPWLAATMN